MATESKAELTYFYGRGLGEIIRLTLTVAEIEFTEAFLRTREDYLALKPELLFGQVPLLRIDGLKLVQSAAIVRYVARKGNLMGANSEETARIEMFYDATRDFYMPFLRMHWTPEQKQKEEIKEKFFPKYLPVFEKVLGENPSGFLVAGNLTLADIGLLDVLLSIVDYWEEGVLQDYPHILSFYRKMLAHERVTKYIKNYRKPKNDDAYLALIRGVLSHLNL